MIFSHHAEEAIHCLREAAIEGDKSALERYVRLMASNVETLTFWIESLDENAAALATLRKLARGWNDWPFAMRQGPKTPQRFTEIADKIQLARDPIHNALTRPDALAHRWLSHAVPRFDLAREYRQHAKSEQALEGSMRAISSNEATGKILFEASKLEPLTKANQREWLRLLVEFTMDSNDDQAVTLIEAAEETARKKSIQPPPYITSLDAGPAGRYLYYIPGAHGGAEKDGTPIVQYDTQTNTRKILCFLHPLIQKHTGYIPIGSFGYAISDDGGTLFVTWNGAHDLEDSKGRVPFRSVALTVIKIPASERPLGGEGLDP